MKINIKAIYYSQNNDIRISNLRKMDLSKSDIDINVYKWIKNNGIFAVVDGDVDYHDKFVNISSKPYIVYGKGNYSLLDKKILGIVGPRKMSSYAQKVLEILFKYLAGYDIVTISGLAYGVDWCCHELSLKYNIPTIAVLGGGIKYFLQSKKKGMIEKILSNGLILSEFKLNLSTTNYSFPQRNRMIAGLSNVLFLPEAGDKSGSLITVDFANKIGVDVFGVPGDIFCKNSFGINKYICNSKINLVYDIKRFIVDNFGNGFFQKKIFNDLNGEEKLIYKLLSGYNSLSVDKLCIYSKIPIEKLFTILTQLELLGLIGQTGFNEYSIISSI